MTVFEIIEELDELDKEVPLIAGVTFGSYWGIAKMWEWKIGNATDPSANEIFSVMTTGLMMGASLGTLAGYFWYFSLPAITTYCVFGIKKDVKSDK